MRCIFDTNYSQSTTGYSPFYLVFGRNARLPNDVMYASDNQGLNTLPEYVRTLQATFAEVFECVHVNIATAERDIGQTHPWWSISTR